MSRSAFAARFAQLVEEPPLTYLTRWRMQKASRLLETSPAGVAEIAKRVGYDAEAAFSKAFKRWIGVAPGGYRRRAQMRVNGSFARPAETLNSRVIRSASTILLSGLGKGLLGLELPKRPYRFEDQRDARILNLLA